MSLPKNWAQNNPEKEKTRREKIRQSKLGKPRPPHIAERMRKFNLGKVGSKHNSWRGGIRIQLGYKQIYVGKRRYVPEHVLVMEKELGRKLNGQERVHHLNGERLDNRIENLHLYSSHSAHIIEEQRLNSFAKQILYGKLIPELQPVLLQAYQQFNVK